MLNVIEVPLTPPMLSAVENASDNSASIALERRVVVLKREDGGDWRAFEVTGLEDTERAKFYAGLYLQTMSIDALANGGV